MRFHTYTKFSPEMADAVDLQSLLDKLADFLLQSGFAGGKNQQPYYGWDFGEDGDRSMEALRQAILNALIESGQFTPEMLEISDCGVTGLAVPDRGMGGNCTAEVTLPNVRSTILMDSPPEFATHSVRPSPSSAISCGNWPTSIGAMNCPAAISNTSIRL